MSGFTVIPTSFRIGPSEHAESLQSGYGARVGAVMVYFPALLMSKGDSGLCDQVSLLPFSLPRLLLRPMPKRIHKNKAETKAGTTVASSFLALSWIFVVSASSAISSSYTSTTPPGQQKSDGMHISKSY